jgi:glycosyltransferase involved in cell wall biosynthesis
VSVIVPVYDSMPYLTGTMESLLAQDLAEGELEVIAIDDGSTDGSGEELDRFAAEDARLRVIHQPNSGWPGMPRNRGLELAGGEYVFFMDSDDTAAPDALRSMLEAADRSGAEVVLPRMRGVGGRRVQPLFDKHPSGPITVSRAMETVSPQKLIRRELIERHGLRFPEGRVRLEDGILMSRVYLLANRLEFCGPRPLYFIAARADGGNISAGAIEPAGYVSSVRAICENLRAGAPDEAAADALVYEFFSRKGMKFYTPKWWRPMSPEDRAEWVRRHRDLLRELLPERFDAAVGRPDEAQLLALLRAGDVAAVDAFVTAREALGHRSALRDARERRGWLRRGGLELSIATEDADARPLSLHLLGRVSATRAVIGARSEGADGSGARIHRFLVPHDALAGFGGEILDLWTSRESADGVSGVPVRVRAEKLPRRLGEAGLYRTKTGYASLRTEGREGSGRPAAGPSAVRPPAG